MRSVTRDPLNHTFCSHTVENWREHSSDGILARPHLAIGGQAFIGDNHTTRRDFLIKSGVGATAANELGFSTAFANEEAQNGRITFGELEPLVTVMRETRPDRLQEILVAKLRKGKTNLKDMTAAGALANARTFGGEDYDGYTACSPSLRPWKCRQNCRSGNGPSPS